MKSCLPASGLVLTLFGAGIMARSELTSLAARIAQAKEIKKGAWHQNIAVQLAKLFGSKNALDQVDFGLPSFEAKFWGFILIFFGTLLQVFGAL